MEPMCKQENVEGKYKPAEGTVSSKYGEKVN